MIGYVCFFANGGQMGQGFRRNAILAGWLLSSSLALLAQPVEVKKPEKHDVSTALRDIPPAAVELGPPREHKPLHPIPRKKKHAIQQAPDIQTAAGTVVATTSGFNANGVGLGFTGPQGSYTVGTAPPDPNVSVGVTQYVQWVNTSFAVFDKGTGNPIYGPVAGNTLWTGFGGACEANNDGDVSVKFDRAAGRWIFTQLAVTHGPPYYQCIAVSTGIDATGSYNRYAFSFSNLNDYPKMGVWTDAYYFSFNMFNGNTFLGANACAADRNQMLASGPATMQCFQLAPSFGAVLPSDVDGITLPPAGSPALFVGIDSASLNLWRFQTDFVNPANSTLSNPVSIPVAPYTEPCNGGGTCIPQSGTSQQLDSLGDRLMYRLVYRNFGDHEALVVNHSVLAGTSVGVRWYELRDPNGAPTLYQQGTYAPDANYRWMGSIALDKVGNIAVGYSVSGSQMHPAIRYTGRAPTDPLGTMQAETSIIEGTGSQVPLLGIFALSRWGDYTAMAIDPTDDCTFFYTNEYLLANGAFNWSTRIASFAFPSCTAAPAVPDFYVTASPASRAMVPGTNATYAVNVNPSGGFNNTVSFSASGLPAGATAAFSPASLSASGSTTMTITAAPGTPLGTYPVMITAASGSLSHTALVTLQIYIPATAAFVRTDTTTQGTWKGVYGQDGEAIPNDSANYPPYAQVSVGGATQFTWVGSTLDVRALQKAAATDRIASTWYAPASFTIDVNLTDGNPHQVGVYCLDWENSGRVETISIIDAVSGNALDSRTISAFSKGMWLLWNLSGHVTIRATWTAGANAVVNGLFFSPPAPPDFSISATPSSQTVSQGTGAPYTVTIAPSAGFAGTVNFSASGLPPGATASFNPASISGSGSTTMTVNTAGALGGSYNISITGASGVLSHPATVGLLVNVAVPAAASFVKTDTTTQGTWKGVYGADGQAIVNDSTSYSVYAQVSVSGASLFTWSASTTDPRALQKAAASDRIVAAWYSGTSFNLDVNLTDGNPHSVGLYALDWDNGGRAQAFDILDAASGTVLDTRTISAFNSGTWVVWNLRGHVIIRVRWTAGNNAVVNGIFFGPPAPPDFSLSTSPARQVFPQGSGAPYSVTVTPLANFSGTVNFSASGLPSGTTASFSPVSVSGAGSTTMTLTTAASTPGGTYNVTVTGTSGSLSHPATAVLVVNVVVPAAAAFVRTDAATQGTWKGIYGADGEAIANDSTNYPAYAQVNVTGATLYTWAASTTDVRALQKAATNDRIASTWTAATTFNIDVNLTDGNPHEIGLYCLDWENSGRTQTVSILDAASGNVLDSRRLSGLGSGLWALWNLSGHVTIRVTWTGGNNAVVAGIFFGPPAPPDFAVSAAPASQVAPVGGSAIYTVTPVSMAGFAGIVTLSASGLPPGATASFNPGSVSGSGSSTMTVGTAAATPAGGYTFAVTGTSGSLSRSTTATLVVSTPAPAGAGFVKADTTTQGTWKGVYGGDGEAIVGDATNYPAYAQVNVTGATLYTWTASTTDARALQKVAASDRIAASWNAATSFAIDVNLLYGGVHQMALYCLDWENSGRAQRIDILDAASGSLLDTRNLSAFGGGAWMVWNLSGHVTVRVTRTAGANAAVSGIFFGAAPAGFLVSGSPSSRAAPQGTSTAYTVSVTPSGSFSGSVSFSASGLPNGASAAFSPASVTAPGSTTMTVTVASSTPVGSYPVTITASSASVIQSAAVTLQVYVPATASFLKTDTATQGTWKGVYGQDGQAIPNDSANYPDYAQVSFSGASLFTWVGSTTDVRALQKTAATDRIASTWYAPSSFSIDMNLTDGNSHQVALYCLDWENSGRVETISITDTVSGSVLDSRTISAFSKGIWVVWNLSGHVTIRATWTAGANAVVNGIFFSPPPAPDFSIAATPAGQTVTQGGNAAYTVTIAPIALFAGTVNVSASGLPAGVTASFTPASVSGSGSVTMTLATTASTPGGNYNITVTGTSGSLSHASTVGLTVSVPVTAAASFTSTDIATQGTWKGVYGAAGEAIANDSANYPPYAQVSFSGASTFTWAASTPDVRALQKAAVSDRIASTWYAPASFTIDVNLLDGNPHNIGLYFLDWDNSGRVETVSIVDAASGNPLDSRTASGFGNGKWLLWNLSGHVTIKITYSAGANAAVAGVFFNN